MMPVPAIITTLAPIVIPLLKEKFRVNGSVGEKVLERIAEPLVRRVEERGGVPVDMAPTDNIREETLKYLEENAKLIKAQISLDEAMLVSEDWFVRRARPFVLYSFGFNMVMVAGFACFAVVSGQTAGLLQVAGLITPLVATHGAAAGYYIRQRTVDKGRG